MSAGSSQLKPVKYLQTRARMTDTFTPRHGFRHGVSNDALARELLRRNGMRELRILKLVDGEELVSFEPAESVRPVVEDPRRGLLTRRRLSALPATPDGYQRHGMNDHR